jgi:hypothetical protein
MAVSYEFDILPFCRYLKHKASVIMYSWIQHHDAINNKCNVHLLYYSQL